MKKILPTVFFTLLAYFTNAQEKEDDNPKERLEHEVRMTMDPKIGRVPYERLVKEREKLNKGFKSNTISSAVSGITWYERGPNNIGGRTRALMIDPNDPTQKRVFAGGVGGGLWYNNDITSSASLWTKIDDFWANIAISAIAFNPVNPQVFYVGTGEGWSSTDALQGAGIYKTTDGGTTWSLLTSTSSGAFADNFKYTQKIVVNSLGEVFAGTQSGVLKSSDGGVTWSVSLVGTSFVSDLEIGTDDVIYAAFGKSSSTSAIYKSSNNGDTWVNITPNYFSKRTEIALAPSTSGASQVIYAMADNGGSAPAWSKKSSDGGVTWVNISNPSILGGQGWYDMIIAVHPTNPNVVIAGGNIIGRSIDGGTTWTLQSYGNPHPDQHAVIFKENSGSYNEVIIGNDGGVIYSADFGNSTDNSPVFSERNNGYNVTQFYGISMKNISNDGYLLGGTQDNNTLRITSTQNTIGAGENVNGGDGITSFIDQDQPEIGLISSQYGYYRYFNTSTGGSTSLGVGSNQFVTTADYDSGNNIFYVDRTNGTTIWKVRNVGGAFTSNYYSTSIPDRTSFIRAGLIPNTIFVGTGIAIWPYSAGGKIYKITNFGELGQVTTLIGTLDNGSVSSISIGATENEILVTQSNYGIKSVHYTNDGGTTWISKDEASYGLPDVPIRYGIFNPQNRKQVLLATELGVWSSADITAANPGWGVTNTGLANVSCHQLYYRSADNTVAVATHGRGIFTAKLIACPNNIVQSGTLSGNQTILSGSYINGKTNNIIESGANVTYSAKNYVLLEPKFETQSNSFFTAVINGCD